jgi:hypothetical protein
VMVSATKVIVFRLLWPQNLMLSAAMSGEHLQSFWYIGFPILSSNSSSSAAPQNLSLSIYIYIHTYIYALYIRRIKISIVTQFTASTPYKKQTAETNKNMELEQCVSALKHAVLSADTNAFATERILDEKLAPITKQLYFKLIELVRDHSSESVVAERLKKNSIVSLLQSMLSMLLSPASDTKTVHGRSLSNSQTGIGVNKDSWNKYTIQVLCDVCHSLSSILEWNPDLLSVTGKAHLCDLIAKRTHLQVVTGSVYRLFSAYDEVECINELGATLDAIVRILTSVISAKHKYRRVCGALAFVLAECRSSLVALSSAGSSTPRAVRGGVECSIEVNATKVAVESNHFDYGGGTVGSIDGEFCSRSFPESDATDSDAEADESAFTPSSATLTQAFWRTITLVRNLLAMHRTVHSAAASAIFDGFCSLIKFSDVDNNAQRHVLLHIIHCMTELIVADATCATDKLSAVIQASAVFLEQTNQYIPEDVSLALLNFVTVVIGDASALDRLLQHNDGDDFKAATGTDSTESNACGRASRSNSRSSSRHSRHRSGDSANSHSRSHSKTQVHHAKNQTLLRHILSLHDNADIVRENISVRETLKHFSHTACQHPWEDEILTDCLVGLTKLMESTISRVCITTITVTEPICHSFISLLNNWLQNIDENIIARALRLLYAVSTPYNMRCILSICAQDILWNLAESMTDDNGSIVTLACDNLSLMMYRLGEFTHEASLLDVSLQHLKLAHKARSVLYERKMLSDAPIQAAATVLSHLIAWKDQDAASNQTLEALVDVLTQLDCSHKALEAVLVCLGNNIYGNCAMKEQFRRAGGFHHLTRLLEQCPVTNTCVIVELLTIAANAIDSDTTNQRLLGSQRWHTILRHLSRNVPASSTEVHKMLEVLHGHIAQNNDVQQRHRAILAAEQSFSVSVEETAMLAATQAQVHPHVHYVPDSAKTLDAPTNSTVQYAAPQYMSTIENNKNQSGTVHNNLSSNSQCSLPSQSSTYDYDLDASNSDEFDLSSDLSDNGEYDDDCDDFELPEPTTVQHQTQ